MSKSPASALHHSGPIGHPSEYLRILYKRRWAALPVFLVVFLSGAIASMRTVPVFEASTQLMIEPDSRRSTSINDVLQDRTAYYDDDFYQTQYRILQSRALALRVAEALAREGVTERRASGSGASFSITGLLRRGYGAATSLLPTRSQIPAAPSSGNDGLSPQNEAVADALLGGLTVTPVRYSRLVDIKFRSADAEFATRAANEFATQYALQGLAFRFSASKEANTWLSTQLEQQKKAVDESEAALQRYRETHGAVSIGDRQNIVVQKLNELNGEVTRAKIERFDREAQYNQVLELRQQGRSVDTLPAIMTNEFVVKARADLGTIQEERLRLDARNLGPNHPDVQALQARMRSAQGRLDAEVEKVVDSMRNAFLAAQARERSMTSALDAQKSEALGMDRKEMEFASLEREAKGNRELYEKLLQNTKESGVSGEYRGSNVQVVDKAQRPNSPVLPNLQRDLASAAGTGLVLALLLAFGIEYLDSRIKSPEEVREHLGLPFLGLVPLAGDGKGGGISESPLVGGGGTPAFAEAMRGLRTAVLFSTADEHSHSILITSTGPHEGKTLVSSSLAASLAQAGQRTLVVDADMRRPRLHEALGGSQEPGLSNVLVGETSIEAAIRPTSVPNLFALPAGHIPPNPAELLGSKKCLELLADLRSRFDWVLLDAPPVLPVTDAAVIAHAVGGVLFVIGAEMTPRQSALIAIDQLQRAHAKMLGVVLNKVNVKRHSYYYRAYYKKEYAKYHTQSADHA